MYEGNYPTPEEDEEVLVGIPAYNEELSIGSLLWKVGQLDMVDEVLVVDDGSADDTAQIASDSGALVKEHEFNQGKGASIKDIFSFARDCDYDYLVLIDGDGQHNPEEIPHVLSGLLNPGADMAIGTRWGEATEMPFYRKMGKFVLDKLTPGGDGRDTQSGFRAFNKKAIEKMELVHDDFTVESEMLAQAEERGLKVENVRITCRYDDVENASTKGPVKHGFSVLNKLIGMTIQSRPMLYLGTIGAILFAAAMVTGGYVIHLASSEGYLSVGFSMLTIIFLVMSAIFITSGFTLNEIERIIKRQNELQRRKGEEP